MMDIKSSVIIQAGKKKKKSVISNWVTQKI